jgi:hypothetical protein
MTLVYDDVRGDDDDLMVNADMDAFVFPYLNKKNEYA